MNDTDLALDPPAVAARAALGAHRRTSVGEQKVDERGYVSIYLPGHPLATRDGWVARHRLVLWKSLGMPPTDAAYPCHWCFYKIPWRSEQMPQIHYGINVDHLNAVPSDDRLENLAASCFWCNANRSWAPILAPQWWDRFRHWFAQIHPAERPHLPTMVGEILGVHPKLLTSGVLIQGGR